MLSSTTEGIIIMQVCQTGKKAFLIQPLEGDFLNTSFSFSFVFFFFLSELFYYLSNLTYLRTETAANSIVIQIMHVWCMSHEIQVYTEIQYSISQMGSSYFAVNCSKRTRCVFSSMSAPLLVQAVDLIVVFRGPIQNSIPRRRLIYQKWHSF